MIERNLDRKWNVMTEEQDRKIDRKWNVKTEEQDRKIDRKWNVKTEQHDKQKGNAETEKDVQFGGTEKD